MSRRNPYDRFTNDGGYGRSYDEEPEQDPGYGNDQEAEDWADQDRQQSYDEQSYEQPYEQAFEPAYEPPYPRREPQRPAVISTNATINLICTICAGCGLFGLFLFFVDKRSRAVRRCAVQSAGLLCVVVFLTAGLAVLATLFGFIPFIGGAMSTLGWILVAALLCADAYLRVRLMAHAYRGEAYVLPLIGRQCRQFG